MKSPLFNKYYHLCIIIFILVFTLSAGCVVSLNMPPKITELQAEHTQLYPKQSTEIKCDVSDPEDDNLTFKWSSTDGSFSGSGPIVTWTAPNKYGEFHIIVIVEDEKGNSSQSNVTINVIVNENDNTGTCKTCG